MIKTYVISLEKSADRREACFNHCRAVGLEPIWFRAINGKEVLQYPQQELFPADVKIDLQDKFTLNLGINRTVTIEDKLSASELGCALSHLSVYHDMVSNNVERALILEDDCLLQSSVAEILPTILTKASLWDIVLLYSESGVRDLVGRRKIFLDEKHRFYMKRKGMGTVLDPIFNRRRMAFLACAYMLNLKAAKRLLSIGNPVRMPADYLTGLISYHHLRLFTCHPMEQIASVNTFESTIASQESRPQHRLK